MSLNFSFRNANCRFYWEDCCGKVLNDEFVTIDESGHCETFEKGVSEWYEAEKEGDTNA